MQSVTLTRKERIMRERAIMAKGWRRRVVGYALAGSVAANVLLSPNLEKALACSDTYVVQKGDNLYSIAKKYGVTVEQMQEANELSSDSIKVGQILEVPLLEEDHAKQEKPSATKKEAPPKQKEPSATNKKVPPKQEKLSTTKKGTNRVYTVVSGDSLYSIAKKYGVSVKQIKEASGLSSDFLKVGQILEVPLLEATLPKQEKPSTTKKKEAPPKKEKPSTTKKKTNRVYTVVPGDSLYILAKRYGVSIKKIQEVNGLTSDRLKVGQKLEIPSEEVYEAKKQTTKNLEEKITYATYTVAPGETLWSIARQFNMSIDEIKAQNHMSSNAVLIGQKLIIKQKNLMKVDAIVIGAIDNFSVEFKINGEATVLQVAYGTASNFERIAGKKVELVFYKANRSTIVSFSLVE